MQFIQHQNRTVSSLVALTFKYNTYLCLFESNLQWLITEAQKSSAVVKNNSNFPQTGLQISQTVGQK